MYLIGHPLCLKYRKMLQDNLCWLCMPTYKSNWELKAIQRSSTLMARCFHVNHENFMKTGRTCRYDLEDGCCKEFSYRDTSLIISLLTVSFCSVQVEK